MKNDTIYGTFKISTMVSYAESLGKNVLAVVNSDFFSVQTGVPLGIVIEDGEYKSSPSGMNAVSFGYDGGVYFSEAPLVTLSLYNNGGGEGAENADKTVTLTNFNKFRTDTGGMYMFSEAFSTVSTRTSSPGWFVKFRILDGMMSVSGTMTLEVTDTLISDGATSIDEGFLVLTAANHSGYGEEYEKFAVGDIVTLTAFCDDENLSNAQYATGGGNMLVSNGVKTDPEEWDNLLKPRAPRTAFGVLEDGSVVCYVVDGRNSVYSVGVTMDELADEMLRQGCVYAINFDGGGSSALSLRLPGESLCTVMNRPSDGSERGCATYILFVTDAVSDGAAKHLGLINDGAIVLAGSSIQLAFMASDNGYMPADVPEDIMVMPSANDAVINDMIYTAGLEAGTDTLGLYSLSTGSSGTGNIAVITAPSSMLVTRKGMTAPLVSVKLKQGETLELDVSATHYSRTVTSQLHSYTYTILGDIGEMVEPGVFAAGESMFKTGVIEVSAAGSKFEILVKVGEFEDMAEHWAKEYAEYLAYAGITTGVTETEYGPERMMKRGDFVLMLYRAAGEPEIGEAEGFDDVDADAYYANAVAWARAAGITEGTGDNNFSPQSPLSREQAFTFVYRALGALNINCPDGTDEDLAGFTDADLVAGYARLASATLIRSGVVEGADGRLTPQATLTRAQMAKILAVTLRLY
jgi:exopolysaccharide biosynthesis protein